MTKISLRAYIREIENLIETSAIDQAIAHCRYILQTHPKHLTTYALLGKALLESKRYADAADIFQRVLSSMPDDFVSHVGMSIIREDEGNLDGAIWHMERAFEIRPANVAIQDELRRLFGRRDGLEPPKIRLTRSALARMYAKGGLYQQAIAELRAALVEDPERADLQVLLARAFYLNGQRAEAVELSTTLLKKLPYCVEANRILAAILPETELAADTEAYRQRVAEMDPYLAQAPADVETAEGVPDNAVSLERLEWKPGMKAEEPVIQPEWATSIGVRVSEPSESEEQLPEWLVDVGAATSETPASGEEFIPEWMKEAGWVPSTSEKVEELEAAARPFADETEGDSETAQPVDAIAPADIPEWLLEIAPPGGEGEMVEEAKLGDVAAEEEISWLTELAAEQEMPADQEVVELEPEQEAAEEPLEALQEENAEALPIEAEMDQTLTEEVSQQVAEEGTPDWLLELGQEEEPEQDQLAGEAAPEYAPPESTEESAGGEKLPEWLIELGEAQATPVEAGSEEGEQIPGEETTETAPPWMIELGKEETVQETPQGETFEVEESETMDSQPADWLKELGVEMEASTPETVDLGDTQPVHISRPVETVEGEVAPGEDGNLPGWLEGLAPIETTEEEVSSTEEGEEAPLPEEAQLPWEAAPPWLKETFETEEIPLEQPEEEVAEAEATPASEMVTGDEAEPDWLKEISTAEVQETAEEHPDWLKMLSQEGEEVEPEVEGTVALVETPVAEIQVDSGVTEIMEETAGEPTEEEVETTEGILPEAPTALEEQPAVEEEHPEVASEETQEIPGLELPPMEEPTLVMGEVGEQAEEVLKQEADELPEQEMETALEEESEAELIPGEAQAPELPEWLTGMEEEPKAEVELPAWLVQAEAEVKEQPTTEELQVERGEEQAPLPVLDINSASLVELENIPGVGFILAQKIISRRELVGAFSNLEELKEIAGFNEAILDGLRSRLEVVPVVTQETTQETEAASGAEEGQGILSQARLAIERGELAEGANLYMQLIRREQQLPKVIGDLQQAIAHGAREAMLCQALGDAYMRSGQLQEALEAYVTAEKLLG